MAMRHVREVLPAAREYETRTPAQLGGRSWLAANEFIGQNMRPGDVKQHG
jgi:hypothetical protein